MAAILSLEDAAAVLREIKLAKQGVADAYDVRVAAAFAAHKAACAERDALYLKLGETETEARDFIRREVRVADNEGRALPELDGVSWSPGWDFSVVDERKLPEMYVKRTPDLAAIRRDVRQMKGETVIPGVEVLQTITVRVS